MSFRRRNYQAVAILTAASAVILTLAIALTGPRPLQFRVMSGVVTPGDHGLDFVSDDFRVDWHAGKISGLAGTPCSKNWVVAGYGRESWGYKMHWRFEGAELPRTSEKSRISDVMPCTIEVKRIMELRIIG